MQSRTFLLLILAISVTLWITGCSDDDNNSVGSSGPAPLTITASHFLPCGSSYANWYCSVDPYQSTDSALADTALGGANCAWQLGLPDVYWDDIDSINYCTPALTPYGNLFPNATRAVGWDNTNNYDYYRLAQDGYYWLGWAWGIEDTFHLNPQMQIMKLPLTMGTTWTNVYRQWDVDYYGDTTWWVDSVVARVDGWGTVNWPYGEAACLRVVAEYFLWDIYQGVPYLTDRLTRYGWLDAHGEIVAEVLRQFDEYGTSIYVTLRMSQPPVAGPTGIAPPTELRDGHAMWNRHRRGI